MNEFIKIDIFSILLLFANIAYPDIFSLDKVFNFTRISQVMPSPFDWPIIKILAVVIIEIL